MVTFGDFGFFPFSLVFLFLCYFNNLIGATNADCSVRFFLSLEVTDSFEFVYIPLFKDRNFLYQKYVVEGLPPAEIAALTFSCRTTVSKHLKHFGIPLRPVDKTSKQLGYGEALRGRRVVAHKREQELVRKMKGLRDQGWSYWKIAEVMNGWNIPTKTKRGKWHAKTIQAIIDRQQTT